MIDNTQQKKQIFRAGDKLRSSQVPVSHCVYDGTHVFQALLDSNRKVSLKCIAYAHKGKDAKVRIGEFLKEDIECLYIGPFQAARYFLEQIRNK